MSQITVDRAVLVMALDALERCTTATQLQDGSWKISDESINIGCGAVDEIRAALEAKQEAVGAVPPFGKTGEVIAACIRSLKQQIEELMK